MRVTGKEGAANLRREIGEGGEVVEFEGVADHRGGHVARADRRRRGRFGHAAIPSRRVCFVVSLIPRPAAPIKQAALQGFNECSRLHPR